MTRKDYLSPTLTETPPATIRLMSGSEEEIPFNPEDGTDDALAKPHDEAPAEDWGHLW